MDKVYQGENAISPIAEIMRESFPGCFKFWNATSPLIMESEKKAGMICCMFTAQGVGFTGKIEIHQMKTCGFLVELSPSNSPLKPRIIPVESVLDIAFVIDGAVRGKYTYSQKYFFSMGRN